MSSKVAFIGLGRMGSGIAANIVKHGMDLVVWNRTASKMAPLLAMGAKGAGSAKEAAAAADIVVTSLMDDQSILDDLDRRRRNSCWAEARRRAFVRRDHLAGVCR